MTNAVRHALATAALALLTCNAFGAATYRVVEMPIVGDDATINQSATSDINEQGVVTVNVLHYGADGHRWDRAQVCTPSPLKCKLVHAPGNTRPRVDDAIALNTRGQVVGETLVDGWQKPYVRDISGSAELVGSFAPNLPSFARGINDDGVVVGYGQIDNDRQRAYFLKDGVTTWLPTLGGDSFGSAYAINNRGQIAGVAATQDTWSYPHAFVYDIATGAMTDLGTLGGDRSVAFDINASGDIAGDSSTKQSNGYTVAMRTVGGVMKNLGTLPGHEFASAYGLNDAGDVVGSSYPQEAAGQGFLFTQAHGMQALDDLVSDADRAAYAIGVGIDINNAGDIAGAATRRSDGRRVAIKLVRIR